MEFDLKKIIKKYSPGVIITGITLLFLYIPLISSRLTSANNGGDGGDFLAAILTNGIPHPTGYPLYILIGRLFQLLPSGTPYFKTTLISVLGASLAACLVSLTVGLLVGKTRLEKTVAMIFAGLFLGTSSLFWSQAVIVEVYGIQSFFVACFVTWMVVICTRSFSRQTDRLLSILAFVSGLGFANHVTLVLLVPAFLFALWTAKKSGYPAGCLVRYFVLSGSGLLFYLYLPFAAASYPPINWGNPQDLNGLIWLVTGQSYRGLVFSVTPVDALRRTGAFFGILLSDFGVAGLFGGLLGLVQHFSLKKPVQVILLWIFLISVVFSIGYSTNDSTGYLIPAMIIFAIWIGQSVEIFFSFSVKKIPVGYVLTLLLAALLVMKIPETIKKVDPRAEISGAMFAEEYLKMVPQDAILITTGDEDTFPLWYTHYGLNQRPDITILVSNLMQYEWYRRTVQHNEPQLFIPDAPPAIWEKEFSEKNKVHAVCHSAPDKQAKWGIKTSCSRLE